MPAAFNELQCGIASVGVSRANGSNREKFFGRQNLNVIKGIFLSLLHSFSAAALNGGVL
jgi:hypothetical protein